MIAVVFLYSRAGLLSSPVHRTYTPLGPGQPHYRDTRRARRCFRGPHCRGVAEVPSGLHCKYHHHIISSVANIIRDTHCTVPTSQNPLAMKCTCTYTCTHTLIYIHPLIIKSLTNSYSHNQTYARVANALLLSSTADICMGGIQLIINQWVGFR